MASLGAPLGGGDGEEGNVLITASKMDDVL